MFTKSFALKNLRSGYNNLRGEDEELIVGIDISPGGAHWSYSGFHRFRERIASYAGLFLNDMNGFGGGKEWPGTDPIEILLNHSDCDGIISPEDCAKIAPRLREIIKEWDIEEHDSGSAMKLVAGMEEAAVGGFDMEFH
jgi:hypothetical protein